MAARETRAVPGREYRSSLKLTHLGNFQALELFQPFFPIVGNFVWKSSKDCLPALPTREGAGGKKSPGGSSARAGFSTAGRTEPLPPDYLAVSILCKSASSK